MKNIQYYPAPKYSTDLYEYVEPQIYSTYEVHEDVNACLSLMGVTDPELTKTLLSLDGWKEGSTSQDEDMWILVYKGTKYYRDPEDEEEGDEIWVYTNMNETKELSYVTSLMFEQEVEFEENEPNNPYISQYPLEDILDKFNCEILDFYEEQNEKDPVYSYIEFSSSKIKNIRNVLSIIGKHVYNKTEGKIVKLIIE